MLTKIREKGEGFKRFFRELQTGIIELMARRIEAQLEGDVERWLQRTYYARREKLPPRETGAWCQKCGSRPGKDFSRNGHRSRQLVTGDGVVDFRMPRVVCECGGSVRRPLSILRPYQRFWDDLVVHVPQWADFGLSLRHLQQFMGDHLPTAVGLRQLNEIVQEVAAPSALNLTSVPPVIMLDAIGVDLLQPTDTSQPDELGRQRVVKSHRQVCILVALGL